MCSNYVFEFSIYIQKYIFIRNNAFRNFKDNLKSAHKLSYLMCSLEYHIKHILYAWKFIFFSVFFNTDAYFQESNLYF